MPHGSVRGAVACRMCRFLIWPCALFLSLIGSRRAGGAPGTGFPSADCVPHQFVSNVYPAGSCQVWTPLICGVKSIYELSLSASESEYRWSRSTVSQVELRHGICHTADSEEWHAVCAVRGLTASGAKLHPEGSCTRHRSAWQSPRTFFRSQLSSDQSK